MAEYTALAPLFTDIANAIRSKTGETGAITANSFPDKIAALSSKELIVAEKDFTASSGTTNIEFAVDANNVLLYPSITLILSGVSQGTGFITVYLTAFNSSGNSSIAYSWGENANKQFVWLQPMSIVPSFHNGFTLSQCYFTIGDSRCYCQANYISETTTKNLLMISCNTGSITGHYKVIMR